MELKNFFVQDLAGNAIPGAIGRLYDEGTTTLAGGLEDKEGNPQGNPMQANAIGQLQFAAPDGRYDLYISSAARNYTIRVEFYDASDNSLKNDLANGTDPAKGAALVSYDSGTVAAILATSKSLPNYAALRAYTGIVTTIKIIDDFRSGRFRRVATVSTGYVDDGGITIIAANGWVWQRVNVGESHVEWFLPQGWVEGVNDDKVAFERASQFQRARGGGTARFFHRHLLNTNTFINDLVHLKGPIPSVGQILNGQNAYDKREGVLIINPAATIYTESSARLSNAILLNKNLVGVLPFANEAAAIAGVAAFAGNAITPAAPDFSLEDCLFLGFDKAVQSVGHARSRFNNVQGDCNNGFNFESSFDVSVISNCHFWPFLTANQGFNTLVSVRPGTAYRFANSDDWSVFKACFSFGYNRGIKIENADSISLIGCAADYDGNLINTTTIGFEITGTSKAAQLIGCKTASQWRGVVVNTTTTERPTVQIQSCEFWNNDEVDIQVTNGYAIIAGNMFSRAPVSVFVEATALGANISANRFDRQTTRPIDGTMTNVTSSNNVFAGTVDTVMGERKINESTATVNRVDAVYGASISSLMRRAGGTMAAPTALPDGTIISTWTGAAHDGTTFKTIAGFRVQTRGAQTPASAPGAIVFSTCASASAASTDRWVMDSDASLKPVADAVANFGSASARINNSYFAVAPTVGSDARYKTAPKVITDKVLDAWANVDYKSYQLLDAVAEKGKKNARQHFGVIAQQVVEAFTEQGLDATDYGLLCHDSWEALDEIPAELDDEGNIVVPKQEAVEAADRYSIRYEEALVLESALMRRATKRLEDRVAAMESSQAQGK